MAKKSPVSYTHLDVYKRQEQCAVIQEEIDNVNAQISQYETLIAQTEQQISETEEKEQAQYELFCRRVRAMEENGTDVYKRQLWH